MSQTVGQKLKSMRIANGFTSYRKFADELGIEPKQYWKIEEDKVDFRISSLKKIISYYGITLSEFFSGIE